MKNSRQFYKYLRTQFSNLEEAKKWYRCWRNDMEQVVPGYGMFSWRAMAHHISNVLEGRKQQERNWWNKSYMDTKYGVEVYWSFTDDVW